MNNAGVAIYSTFLGNNSYPVISHELGHMFGYLLEMGKSVSNFQSISPER